MNKIVVFVSFLAFFSLKIQSQKSFEGMLIYDVDYKSKSSRISNNQLNRLMGTKQWYAIKDNNYKSVFSGSFIKLQIYRNDENRNYSLTAKSDTLYYEDYSKNKNRALSYEIKKNQDTIIGIPCDLITIKAEKSRTSYYFNSRYKVNPELFKGHNYGNWYYIVSKIKALPLKTITETEQFIMTSTVSEVKPMQLNDNVFEIQNKDKVAPAYW
ncbi:hypothetical protein [Tenacibaculum maritimum]|uniref:hypothetical protein n=1 Tax=Tenacibaculum maritimum TaxID=107401 RepID=UPI0012E4CD5C|nr:hypothetical protein [Tenacibaculum maritimum]CAA0226176.1 conserved hypothetical protein [Tenacibaculum maritimum]